MKNTIKLHLPINFRILLIGKSAQSNAKAPVIYLVRENMEDCRAVINNNNFLSFVRNLLIQIGNITKKNITIFSNFTLFCSYKHTFSLSLFSCQSIQNYFNKIEIKQNVIAIK